jgi:hypothetical protein
LHIQVLKVFGVDNIRQDDITRIYEIRQKIPNIGHGDPEDRYTKLFLLLQDASIIVHSEASLDNRNLEEKQRRFPLYGNGDHKYNL